jgi:hypothetical protein
MNLRNKLVKVSIYFIFFAINFLITIQFLAVTALYGKIDELFAFQKNIEHWIKDAYLVAIFISLLIFLASAKHIEKRIKRKNFFLEGIIYFSLGSLVCYFANSADLFVFGRIVQGLGAGIILFLEITVPVSYQSKIHLRHFWAIAGLVAGVMVSDIVATAQRPINIFWSSFPLGVLIFIFSTKTFQDFIFSNIVSFIARYKKRLAMIGIGISANQIFAFIFDFMLYPYVMWKLGLVKGFVVMSILSAIVCYLLIVLYDWLKKDWLGIETLKQFREYESKNILVRLLSRLFKKNDSLIFWVLSTQFDPFIAILYYRKGSHQYGGLSKKEWRMFFFSLLAGDLYWSLMTFSGVSAIEYLWRIFSLR